MRNKREVHPEQRRRVAVFDVDGTIFRSSLLIQLVNKLIEDGAFPEGARRAYERELTPILSAT